jgi:hypothetical protein
MNGDATLYVVIHTMANPGGELGATLPPIATTPVMAPMAHMAGMAGMHMASSG